MEPPPMFLALSVWVLLCNVVYLNKPSGKLHIPLSGLDVPVSPLCSDFE